METKWPKNGPTLGGVSAPGFSSGSLVLGARDVSGRVASGELDEVGFEFVDGGHVEVGVGTVEEAFCDGLGYLFAAAVLPFDVRPPPGEAWASAAAVTAMAVS